jgi:lipopolysaccharide export system ATP-binding protein
VRISPNLWKEIAPRRAEFAEAMRETGEHSRVSLSTPPRPALIGGSVLEGQGLTKIYRGRKVVNDVALRLQQGEIVGLLGPNGAGKTTTFYMIVGLIPPDSGRILVDGQDISKLPMYERARRGIGYLSQEPSIFRKLSVEDNILAILETLPLSSSERSERLEKLLDELSIKRLRKSKAYALSGGERRRLEITRALVTDPKFMMLDEPFAGVDPIAVRHTNNRRVFAHPSGWGADQRSQRRTNARYRGPCIHYVRWTGKGLRNRPGAGIRRHCG